MSYLLDTMVVSELSRRRPNRNVLSWIDPIQADELFLSTITITEIEVGIERQRRANPDFAAILGDWLEVTLRGYAERVLPLDVAIARRWGQLAARIGNKGFDLAIAATAIEHGLTVATRNVAHFAATGADVVNPFEAS